MGYTRKCDRAHVGSSDSYEPSRAKKHFIPKTSHDVAVGQSFRYIVLVHIRWQWITLPIALLLFALAFLLATVWRSTKDAEQIGIWKTSALAILFNGLGEDVQGYVGAGNNGMGYTRRKAKDLKVHLDDD